MIYILFAIGFFFLTKGADILILGSSAVAKKFGLSDIVIGLTIVSIGTSLPELFVNVMSSFNGATDIAIGNVLGSNIANVLLILGLTITICSVPISKGSVFNDIPFSLVAILLVGFLANASVWPTSETEGISRIDGFFLLFIFLLFMAYVVNISMETHIPNTDMDFVFNPYKSIGFILGGCIMLFLGGKWVVEGAIHIASIFGMSQKLISLTIVAIGTSLPELVTSVIAALKKQTDVAVGNVIGSNIFNALWVLGLSATISPLPFDKIANFDLLMVVLSTVLLLSLIVIRRSFQLVRWQGIVLVGAYGLYLVYLIDKG
jgi:cation:H+ antiporter